MNNTTSMRETSNSVYFWGGPFSQWHHSGISLNAPLVRMGRLVPLQGDSRVFNCAEQYMMAGKALLFNDADAFDAIMASNNPKDQKAIGRRVKGFNEALWRQHARNIVFLANWGKFAHDGNMAKLLLDTHGKQLVEGSPWDKIWGVGLRWDDPAIEDPSNWLGTNWLGECLMRVRELMRVEGCTANPWLLYDSQPWSQ